MLKRGAKIGILGGGQLGRMLSHAAYNLGFETIIYEPQKACPASLVTDKHVCADYNDIEALQDFARKCDIVTFEFENIPLSTARAIEQNVKLFPSSKALELTQDRLIEKEFINSIGLSCAPFFPIDSIDDLNAAIAIAQTPCILKTRRMGYDGKGQFVIKEPKDAEIAWREIGENPAILEGFVKFEFETSIILTRGQDGAVVFYPNSQNIHKNGILKQCLIPAPLNEVQIKKAQEIGAKIANSLDYVGTIAVELFVGDEIIVNEIAPRVHNSGHWTIEGCATSQFANHIRAICGAPLGNTNLNAPSIIMENLLGEEIFTIEKLLSTKDTFPHDYGKSEVKKGRKMGHVTRLLR